MTKFTRVARGAAVAAASIGLGAIAGCSSPQHKSSANVHCTTIKVSSALKAPGPSLVAGDALAFQTRLAGGYDTLPVEDGRRYAAVLLTR